MFNKIRLKIRNRSLQSDANGIKRNADFVNLHQAKTVGILFDAKDHDNYEKINDFAKQLKKGGIQVNILGYKPKIKKDEVMVFPCFSEDHLNWYFKPTSSYIKEFSQKPFDILINAYMDELPPLLYVSALSHAKFRIGRYLEDKTHCFDLMVNTPAKKDVAALLHQIKHYLEQINKHEQAV